MERRMKHIPSRRVRPELGALLKKIQLSPDLRQRGVVKGFNRQRGSDVQSSIDTIWRATACPAYNQGRKISININFLARISCRHSWPLRPNAPGSKSFSPPPGPQENALFGADVHDFRRGRPWPEGLLKNFVLNKVCVDFLPLYKWLSGEAR